MRVISLYLLFCTLICSLITVESAKLALLKYKELTIDTSNHIAKKKFTEKCSLQIIRMIGFKAGNKAVVKIHFDKSTSAKTTIPSLKFEDVTADNALAGDKTYFAIPPVVFAMNNVFRAIGLATTVVGGIAISTTKEDPLTSKITVTDVVTKCGVDTDGAANCVKYLTFQDVPLADTATMAKVYNKAVSKSIPAKIVLTHIAYTGKDFKILALPKGGKKYILYTTAVTKTEIRMFNPVIYVSKAETMEIVCMNANGCTDTSFTLHGIKSQENEPTYPVTGAFVTYDVFAKDGFDENLSKKQIVVDENLSNRFALHSFCVIMILVTLLFQI